MPNRPARLWSDLTLAERVTERLATAALLDQCRPAAGCSSDPARLASAERRAAAEDLTELAGHNRAAPAGRRHRA